MGKKTFTLTAHIRTEKQHAIKQVLEEIMPKKSITPIDEGFPVKARMRGQSARELNRELRSALRHVEPKTRWRAEWVSEGRRERFFDYVPKGSQKA